MLRLPRPLWTSAKSPRRVARPNLRDYYLIPPSLMTSFARLSVSLLSRFPVSNSTAPSQGMAGWLGRLDFPSPMSVTSLSGPVHNSPLVFPKC